MCVNPKEFSNTGFFSSIFLEGVSDAGGELGGGGENHSLSKVDGTMEALLRDNKPVLAGFGDEEVYAVGIADALKLYIIHIEFKWDMSMNGPICFKGFEAV